MPEQGFRGLTPNELMVWRPPFQEYIIGNDILLSKGTLGIYGAEGRWKSMLALDLMYKVSTGKDWFGFNTVASSSYYFQSEIPQRPLQKRSIKYQLGNQITSDNCWLATELYEKIDKGWGASLMERELDRTNPKVLIVDPLYNSVSAKLVDDYEVGLVIDRLNQWRKKYQCAIVLIHHNRQEEHVEGQTFHYSTDEWFGSSRWKRWLDTMIYVELLNDGNDVVDLKLNFEKTRHTESKIEPFVIEAHRSNLVIKRKGGI